MGASWQGHLETCGQALTWKHYPQDSTWVKCLKTIEHHKGGNNTPVWLAPAGWRFFRISPLLARRDGISNEVCRRNDGYAYFEAGNAGLEVFSWDRHATALGEPTPAPVPADHLAILSFEVENVDITYTTLVERGATPVAEPQDRPEWLARTGHLADPDGCLIELYQSLQPQQTDAPTA